MELLSRPLVLPATNDVSQSQLQRILSRRNLLKPEQRVGREHREVVIHPSERVRAFDDPFDISLIKVRKVGRKVVGLEVLVDAANLGFIWVGASRLVGAGCRRSWRGSSEGCGTAHEYACQYGDQTKQTGSHHVIEGLAWGQDSLEECLELLLSVLEEIIVLYTLGNAQTLSAFNEVIHYGSVASSY